MRAGMIRKLASGLYTAADRPARPEKVENIVREEMNNAGAIEVSMPSFSQPTWWQESGRWEQYGPNCHKFVDRGERPFVPARPTKKKLSPIWCVMNSALISSCR